MTVTDLAACILKNRGQAVHFKELISEIMRVKAISQENPGRLIAQMHTEINLDSRFVHLGSGEWGLREWQNKGGKIVKIRPESSSPAPKKKRAAARAEEDDEDEYDEQDEDENLDEDEELEDDDAESEGDTEDYYDEEEDDD